MADIESLAEGHKDNAEKIAKVTAATYDWSQFFSTPTGKTIGGILLVLAGLISSYITDKMNTSQPPIVQHQKSSYVVYVTETTKKIPFEASLAEFALSVDTKVYQDGLAYRLGETMIPLPCVIKVGSDGKAISGTTFEKATDIADFCKKGK